jgi:hypothetical protein
VLNQDVQQADTKLADFGERVGHLTRDQMEAAGTRREVDLPLNPHAVKAISGDDAGNQRRPDETTSIAPRQQDPRDDSWASRHAELTNADRALARMRGRP